PLVLMSAHTHSRCTVCDPYSLCSSSAPAPSQSYTLSLHDALPICIVIELMVGDLIACVTAVKHADGTIIQEPVKREWGVIEAVIADPDGYRIWVVQPT